MEGRRRFRGRDRRPAALSRHGSLPARTDGTMATTRENGLIARENGLVKGVGLIDSTTLVMRSMIGSVVFIVAADISRQVQSPGLMMLTWFVTAALTLIAALSYGELAANGPEFVGLIFAHQSSDPGLRTQSQPGRCSRTNSMRAAAASVSQARVLLRSPTSKLRAHGLPTLPGSPSPNQGCRCSSRPVHDTPSRIPWHISCDCSSSPT